ncbi:efflux RND transporter periplasmic adaptor subunit [Bacillus weihaiensis]|uniref:Uncharacterized protein n=1 Tax=Bacillus weihaiensis TaxID=1547283 RepID=A0A1L3MSX0_9BACI|nr:efflux RND transporter periplasmic adaptor subunit [Bacillus weihaiensis]APH05448.1 hypothetical protein A9C19_12180 [Bacillus weihaiensis]
MKKKIWISVGVVMIIAVLVGINVLKGVNKEIPEVTTFTVKEQEISGTVMVPGTLSLKDETKVYFEPEKGEVAEILVEVGEEVQEGTVLLRYENEQLELEKEQNALSLESSYLRINQVKKQIESLEGKEKDLAKQIGDDEANKQIETERSQLNTDLKVADLEARQVLLQKETIEKKIGELDVKSEGNGTILSVNSSATTGQQDTPLIHIAEKNELIVKGKLSEYDSLKIKEKQAVTLTSDVLPEDEWQGTVNYVGYIPEITSSGIGTEEQSAQYPIEIIMKDKEIKAKPGFKLIMEIETEKRTSLVIPLEAVKQEGDKQIVYISKNGKVILKEVETGTTSGEMIELISGVDEGDKIIVDSTAELDSNMEVIEND